MKYLLMLAIMLSYGCSNYGGDWHKCWISPDISGDYTVQLGSGGEYRCGSVTEEKALECYATTWYSKKPEGKCSMWHGYYDMIIFGDYTVYVNKREKNLWKNP